MNKFDITVLVPTMNEEITISEFIDSCRAGFKRLNLNGQIIIADSSTDKTTEIAVEKNIEIVNVKDKGLGNAYTQAIPFIKSDYVILGDADLTYDFSNIDGFENIEKNSITYYNLEIPNEISIKIVGKDYIRYLKQIRNVSKKENLSSDQTNFTEKKWIKGSIESTNNEDIKVKLILHGDLNDHISIPYSSLRVSAKNQFFSQLKQFILFRPETRRYEGEVFGTLFFKKIGIISPYTKYVKVQINDNNFFTYIF